MEIGAALGKGLVGASNVGAVLDGAIVVGDRVVGEALVGFIVVGIVVGVVVGGGGSFGTSTASHARWTAALLLPPNTSAVHQRACAKLEL